MLEGTNAALDEEDEQRDRLLAGFRWILVDEYQDIKELECSLISALAGRILGFAEKPAILHKNPS